MKNLILVLLACTILFSCRGNKKEKYQPTTHFENGYSYVTVANDPLKARIYTLANGLKVYMTVYKDAPRIQTYVAIGAGSKNDPAFATGLAHYLEHILFKGTSKIGSANWEKEKVLLDQIESLYETYRKTTDTQKRAKLYHHIDSISGVAATFAIANEYDKLMGSIGAQGTNAYTFVEQTVYVNDIPSNQLNKWAEIESERFGEVVPRLFHTELEAVYEEKNRGLDSDQRKVWETMLAELFKKHTYGTQTTIGTVEHLKSPSITEIKKFFYTYYNPNNMAICLSGDFDPSEAIKIIDKNFGKKQSKTIPKFTPPIESEISKPIIRDVFGPDAQSVSIAYRFPSGTTREAMLMEMVSAILANGQAGLIDIDLNQKQKLLGGYSYALRLKDYSVQMIGGNPREGQTLEEVKSLLINEIEKIKKGEFDEWLIKAIINNSKIERMKHYESNESRADAFVTSFTMGINWNDYLKENDLMSSFTKDEIVKFANNYYKNNYIVVNKRTGIDTTIEKVPKPIITPVTVNREAQSDFYKKITSLKSNPIAPVFLDYTKDFDKITLKNNLPAIYKKNTVNGLFELYYILELGTNTDPKIGLAVQYLDYLGTSKLSAEELKKEFYKLGCSFGVYSGQDKVYVMLSGLNDSFEPGVKLFEELLNDAKPNDKALSDLVAGILKERLDSKLNKSVILRSAMVSYAKYGAKSAFNDLIKEDELKKIKANELTTIIKNLCTYQHKVMYYGPSSVSSFSKVINTNHQIPAKLTPCPPQKDYPEVNIDETKVYFVNYDMVQAEVVMISKSIPYNKDLQAISELFNQYFGGDMSSIVFQDIRESKALAYAVRSRYAIATEKGKSNYVVSYIGTQADKLPEAIPALDSLLNELPKADENLKNAKESIIKAIESERITKSAILMNYESIQKLGLDTDIRKTVYEKVPSFKFEDVEKFHKNYISNKPKTILVLGSRDKVNLEFLKKYGPIKELTLEEIFGY